MIRSRSLESFVLGSPQASSNPTLPPGPHGKVRSCHLSSICRRALKVGVRGTYLEERCKRRSSSGRTIRRIWSLAMKPPQRSPRVAPRTPTAIQSSGASSRRTTTHGEDASASFTQASSAYHPYSRTPDQREEDRALGPSSKMIYDHNPCGQRTNPDGIRSNQAGACNRRT